MTAYMRSLFNSKELDISKLRADMTLNDLANRTSDKGALQARGLSFICGQNALNPIPTPVSECTTTIRSPLKIYGITGHMHQLGKNISVTYTEATTSKA